MKKKMLTVSILLLSALSWFVFDEALDKETRQWLVSPDNFDFNQDSLTLLADYSLPESLSVVYQKCFGRSTTRCQKWISKNREISISAIPDEEYFQIYETVFSQNKIKIHGNDVATQGSSVGSSLIKATNLLVLNELVKYGYFRASTVARILPLHRRHLSQSEFLIDRMIFLATLGILSNAAATAPQYKSGVDLTEELAPLTHDELSMKRSLQGELRFAASSFKAENFWYVKTNIVLNLMRKHYQQLVDISELSRDKYWITSVEAYKSSFYERFVGDPLLAYLGYLPDLIFHGYVDYIQIAPFIDLQLYLARSLSQERLSEPPVGWLWKQTADQLCLIPSEVNIYKEKLSKVKLCIDSLG